MSVWLTPNLKPFFGGTYFPPDGRWGRPGFRSVLQQLASAWQNDRAKILQSGDDIVQQLEGLVRAEQGARAGAEVLESCFHQFRRSFDTRLGGFGGAPKFPRPTAFNFLFRYAKSQNNDEARQMALLTLEQMAKGGMNDQLGGGFHRYSVDARWFVPHFEKMLYDQAQLATSYIEAFQITANPLYAKVARDIFEYVLRDMTNPAGAFYSAEDADSVIDPAHPEEKGEGAFYIWSQEEIERTLGQPVAEWFCYRYGVEPGGNVAEDPHNEFRGRNILYQRATIEETAKRGLPNEPELREALDQAIAKLLVERGKRVRPHLDDKILTAWNGLMISALAKGARALHEERYLVAAQRAVGFVLSELYRNRTLLRRWRDGESAIPGFLDDYAFLAQALLDLYEADFDADHIRIAIELTDRMRVLFEDPDAGGFFSTTTEDPTLVMRMKEDYDGAEPSGNSIAILNLLRLSRITGCDDYRDAADKALAAFSARMAGGPTGLPQMLVALLYSLEPPQQVVLAGDRLKLASFRNVYNERFLPFHTLLWSASRELNPELATMNALDGQAAAYICENFACQMPTTDAAKFAEMLP
jgi:uncharacterized protein YyaL (SSP411 family)